MSFSGKVKEELERRIDTARHCNMAEIAAFLCACGSVHQDMDGKKYIQISSENECVLRKCFTLLKKTYNIVAENAECSEAAPRGKGQRLLISGEEEISALLSGTRVQTGPEKACQGKSLFLEEQSLLIKRDCCRRAFIRGSFMSSGSISDPRKSYHFEIVCADEQKAEQLQTMICSFGIDAKTVLRKKSHVVYVKEGAQIVDMLAVMGANVALMDLENIRILKEISNSVNRKVNCETANISKTVSAAVKQMDDIRLIQEKIGFQSLAEGLAETARLRIEYPEASLKELGSMLNPQVGKSGINHRLRRLGEIAEGLRKNEEELL